MTAPNLRLIDVSGNGSGRGAMHGEELREPIAEALERWRELVAERDQVRPDDYVREFLGNTGFVQTVTRLAPDLYDEVLGIAAGSNQPVDDVVAYNFMDEQWRFDRAAVTGCSVIGAVVDDSNEVLLSQNMDLPTSMGGSQTVLRIAADGDRPAQLVMTAAGLIGLLGVNAAGVACCVNTLRTLPAATTGMPVSFIARRILEHRDAASAGQFVTSIPHASGQHYGIADPTGLRGYECSSAGCVPGPAGEKQLLHTNHPLWWDNAGQFEEKAVTTYRRLESLEAGLAGVRKLGDVRPLLSSTANGLCVTPTPERNSATFCSAEFRLNSPPSVRVAMGRPDQAAWHSIDWAD